MKPVNPKHRPPFDRAYTRWKVELLPGGSAVISGSTVAAWESFAAVVVPTLVLLALTGWSGLLGGKAGPVAALLALLVVAGFSALLALTSFRQCQQISLLVSSDALTIRRLFLGLRFERRIAWANLATIELVGGDFVGRMSLTTRSGRAVTITRSWHRFITPPPKVWWLLLHDVTVPEPARAILVQEIERCERLVETDPAAVAATPPPVPKAFDRRIESLPDRVMVRFRGSKSWWLEPLLLVAASLGTFGGFRMLEADTRLSGWVLLIASGLLFVLSVVEAAVGGEEITATTEGFFLARRSIFGRSVHRSAERPLGAEVVARPSHRGGELGHLLIKTREGPIIFGAELDVDTLRWLAVRMQTLWRSGGGSPEEAPRPEVEQGCSPAPKDAERRS